MNIDALLEFINNIRTIKWITLAFAVIVLIIDLLLFSSLFQKTGDARIQRYKNVAVVEYFKGLVAKKDALPRAAIMPQENIDNLLDEIGRIADKNKISCNIGGSLETDKLDGNKYPYARKDFDLEASGSFRDLGVFLTALRNLPEAILDVESFHLTADPDNGSILQAKITFLILTTKDEDI